MIGFISGPRTRIAAVAGLVLLGVGCERASTPRHTGTSATIENASSDQLSRAMDLLERMDEFEHGEALQQATYFLNRWADGQQLPPGWKVDPMADRLPRHLRGGGFFDDVASMTFNTRDAEAIQEAVWMRNVAQWVVTRPEQAAYAPWQMPHAGLDDIQQEQLAIAGKLFDWTIRNLQLETTLPFPEESVAPSAGGAVTEEQRIPPPKQAIAGPGYRYPPADVLQFGSADALQRSRAFMLLARQEGIDVAYLAFPGQGVPPRPRPWLTGVLLGKELYLFDCELGLPIPGPGRKGIARLSQVLDDPTLLRTLDTVDDKYPVTAAELDEVLAMLETSPSSLSYRMELLEANLAGDLRTILTSHPTDLAERLSQCRGVSASIIWSIPYETIWFREAFNGLVQSNPEVARNFYATIGIFKTRNVLMQGRHLHLRGIFEKQTDRLGAKGYYMQSRLPQAAINEIETSREVQQLVGLVRGPQEGDFVWQAKLANARMMATQGKLHATYWLGLCHYASGDYDSAVTWLKERTLETSPDGPWKAGARYNLARAYEARGDIDKACETLLEDDYSPQSHGNQLRARWLKQHVHSGAGQNESQPQE